LINTAWHQSKYQAVLESQDVKNQESGRKKNSDGFGVALDLRNKYSNEGVNDQLFCFFCLDSWFLSLDS